ncbi:MAG: hypothetical protein JNM14_14015 [Ferruginibacter sp.]|nr:hypothetical protein [Ferruginibacter sp.]
MVKYFFLIFSVITTEAAFAQLTVNIQWQSIKPGYSGDTIYYETDRKLSWADFKGRPDAASPAAAITQSGFGYRMSMQSYNNRTTINITVFCYFNKNKSWVKRGMKTNYALEHEQHHYDITYINTCKFIQMLKEAKLTKSNFASVVEKIHDDCFEALNKTQDEYDGQTSNGRIESMQFAWNKKINEQLAALATD